MRVVFVGPSLPAARSRAAVGIDIRAPAIQGDIAKAVCDGATVIGLVDGLFENHAPVWHKEILQALSVGVTVYGAASMGALRAAECDVFGMIGLGKIYRRYSDRQSVDDSDVALVHGPAELDYLPLSIPLVNVLATLQKCREFMLISRDEANLIETSARRIFYKSRTWKLVFLDAGISSQSAERVMSGFVDQKRLDAEELFQAVAETSDELRPQNANWTFHSIER